MTPLDIVTEERAKFTAPLTNEECVLVCNRVATRLALGECGDSYRDAGLLTKAPEQNHGVGLDGNLYAVDICMFREDGAIYDILVGADAGAEPSWNHAGFVSYESWRAPFYESTVPVDPPLTACCAVCQNIYDHHGWGISEMRASLARIEAKLGIA